MENVNVNESKGCVLTENCLLYLGKDNNSKGAALMHSFYNDYLKNSEIGKYFLKTHEKTMPQIIERINVSPKSKICYDYIYTVINRCVRLIRKGEKERAFTEYRFMVENLKEECTL